MELFAQTWDELRATVAQLSDDDFDKPSGCAGWLVRDLVCHLIIDAQDVLITLVTPADSAPTRDAVTYWTVADDPPTGEDPLDALIVRLPPRIRSRGSSSSISTTSAPPPVAPPSWPTPRVRSAPATRCSPRAITCPRTSSNGRCTTST